MGQLIKDGTYLMYLRKSRADNPDESVEEVLAKHEKLLQDYFMRELGHRIPEDCIYREVVSGGEDIADSSLSLRVEHLLEGNAHGVLHLIAYSHHQTLVETLELEEIAVYHIYITAVFLDRGVDLLEEVLVEVVNLH